MGIPSEFCRSVAGRLLTLHKRISDPQITKDVEATSLIAILMPLVIIPFERMKSDHPFRPETALESAFSRVRHADFNTRYGVKASFFRAARQDSRCDDDPNRWVTAADFEVKDTFRVIRNALAHGNILYLNACLKKEDWTNVAYVAFVTRQSNGRRCDREPYHRIIEYKEEYDVVVLSLEDLERFLAEWSNWVQANTTDQEIEEVAA